MLLLEKVLLKLRVSHVNFFSFIFLFIFFPLYKYLLSSLQCMGWTSISDFTLKAPPVGPVSRGHGR